MYGSPKWIPCGPPSLLSTVHIEAGSPAECRTFQSQAVQLVSLLWEIPCSLPHSLSVGITGNYPICPSFYMVSGDPNSGPQAGTSNDLSSAPSPWPSPKCLIQSPVLPPAPTAHLKVTFPTLERSLDPFNMSVCHHSCVHLLLWPRSRVGTIVYFESELLGPNVSPGVLWTSKLVLKTSGPTDLP